MKDVNATVIVDLDRPEEEILQSLKKQTRTGIRKAIKNGLTVEESNDWDEAYKVYRDTRKRTGVRARTMEDLQKLSDKMFVCKKDGKIIAVNFTWFTDLYDKEIPRTMTNAILMEYSNERPNDLLYWEVFKHYKALGYKKFDLGGYAIKVRENLDQVNKFKESFGEVTYFYKDYPFFTAIARKLVRNFNIFWNLNKLLRKKNYSEKKEAKDE